MRWKCMRFHRCHPHARMIAVPRGTRVQLLQARLIMLHWIRTVTRSQVKKETVMAARKSVSAKSKKAPKSKKMPKKVARKAAKKSVVRKAAEKKVPRKAAKKVVKKIARAPKAKAAAKRKPAPAGKRQAAAKKKKKSSAAPRRLSPAPVLEIDNRIAILRANLRDLVEQAASSAGAASEELMSQRITEHEEKLRLLTQERGTLLRRR